MAADLGIGRNTLMAHYLSNHVAVAYGDVFEVSGRGRARTAPGADLRHLDLPHGLLRAARRHVFTRFVFMAS
jgi:hypothetical protein